MAIKERWKSKVTGEQKRLIAMLKESTPNRSTKCDPHNINEGYINLGTKIKHCQDPLLLWQGIPQPNQLSHFHSSKNTSDTRLQAQQSWHLNTPKPSTALILTELKFKPTLKLVISTLSKQ
jgi:hypothetical protein